MHPQPNVRWSWRAIEGSGYAATVILRSQLNLGVRWGRPSRWHRGPPAIAPAAHRGSAGQVGAPPARRRSAEARPPRARARGRPCPWPSRSAARRAVRRPRRSASAGPGLPALDRRRRSCFLCSPADRPFEVPSAPKSSGLAAGGSARAWGQQSATYWRQEGADNSPSANALNVGSQNVEERRTR